MATYETQLMAQGNDQDRLWNGFLARDRSLDGVVICGVISTGIYCRPTCPARRPRRSQVVFFDSAAEARNAGLRACRRCHPDRPETDADLVRAACEFAARYLETHERAPRNPELAAAMGIGSGRLQRLFRETTGLTPAQYVRGLRVERFKSLAKGGANVSEAIYDSGFGSSSRLYENAVQQLGMTPATYRKGGAGAVIRYVTERSSMGWLLVGATAKGVCSVKMGDDATALVAELHREFSAATLIPAGPGDGDHESQSLKSWLTSILGYLDGHDVDIDLPLDVKATAFQWRVWRQLQSIPAGERRSYQQMARALGNDSASRAVGRACATNPVAPIIPCHRAVRQDGALAGYRWGLHRKEALLEMEHRQAGQQS